MNSFLHTVIPRLEVAPIVTQSILRLIVAAVLGGLIGLERELKHKPAGLRTNLFICFGSALFTLLSEQLASNFIGDHTRIAAQIIPGIGFIGAGSILHARNNVTGLTTAATLFVVAAVGMAVGGGLYYTATFATLVIVLCLYWLGLFEGRFKPLLAAYEISGPNADALIGEVNRILEEEHRFMQSMHVAHADDHYRIQFVVETTPTQQNLILQQLRKSSVFQSVSSLGPSEGE
jgi:putative Mg2+ transporter-C (MgtC) family protein